MEESKEIIMVHRYKVFLVLALSALLLTIVGKAVAQIEVPRITIHELKGMIDQGASVLILDTRPSYLPACVLLIPTLLDNNFLTQKNQ